MFAGAAREVVFANPEVVRRVNHEFIPVALKAALVNNPPLGAEGQLYAEIGRSKPAPQGICTANSSGKVLAWALSFDDEKSILKFLDHVKGRYRQSPGAAGPVVAQRFMKFPSRPLADVEDSRQPLEVPSQHTGEERCPAKPGLEEGTLVGKVIGRALGRDGKPVADTTRQEHYMEARFEVPLPAQRALCSAAKQAGEKRFHVPDMFARALVQHAFLGQLDVNPLGSVPGSRNDHRSWEFTGQKIESRDTGVVTICIAGKSDVEGGPDQLGRGTDGRDWEHRVTLRWHGYAKTKNDRVIQLGMLARGDERLRWGNPRLNLTAESDVEHLMAGHPIDLSCGVRYALVGQPCAPDEVVESVVAAGPGPGAQRGRRMQAKMQRLQEGVQRWQQSRRDMSEVASRMRNLDPLLRGQKFDEAEALLDEVLELLGDDGVKKDRPSD